MSSGEAARQIQDTIELVEVAELAAVKFHELSSRRADEAEASRPSEPIFGIEVRRKHDPTHLLVGFRLTITHMSADYVIDVATYYEMSEPVDVPPEVFKDFIERVAIMTAYPFMREALATMAARLEVEVPMLGLLKAGQFQLEPQEAAGATT